MTENSILHSVQFFDNNKEPTSTTLTGGGMDNAPQPKIPPTDINLSTYVAFFPDYQLDNGSVLKPILHLVWPYFCQTILHIPMRKSFVKILPYPWKTKNILRMTILRQTRVLCFHQTTEKVVVTVKKYMCRQKGGAFAPHATPTQNTMSLF